MKDKSQHYILHPGKIISKNDGQEHYISAGALTELYGIRLDQCVIFEKARRYSYPPDWIHLWPDFSGEYMLPIKN